MKRRIAALGALVLAGVATCAGAHEVRPAYLEVRELGSGQFSVFWKTPMRGDARLALTPEIAAATDATPPAETTTGDAASIQRWTFRSAGPLRGTTVRIAGLEATMTDALGRIEFADGTSWTHRFTPQAPSAAIAAEQGIVEAAGEYFRLGVEHIASGADHLLFVLGLMLLLEVPNGGRRHMARLVRTITAFTVAHSVTLALATLGFVRVPPAPVEAAIALSIVFVAAEILTDDGEAGPSLAKRAPWLIAFGFGLLHGFGFAGALSQIGLPPAHIPVALLFFNVGVEAGQIAFVATVLVVIATLSRLAGTGARLSRVLRTRPAWPRVAAAYGIGSISMYWVLLRASAL